ncbi:torsin-1A-interacting protein 2-like [Centroberyx affinis]|uniref:torsin-1A-interacting protein 2-like n=1 Tax=Centroberyx affinis TaxID=166261 RepID=UPI003A5C19DD
MDSKVSQNKDPRPSRRSTRQSSIKALNVELTPRGPLKRTRRGIENKVPVAAVNGSKDAENASEDEESPRKKIRLEAGGEADGSGDENEMDVQETNDSLEKKEDQEMIPEEDPPHRTHQQKMCQGSLDMNFAPRVVLKRCPSSHPEHVDTDWIPTKRVPPSRNAASIQSATQLRPLENKREVPISKIISMAEYKENMKAKAKSAGVPRINHNVPRVYSTSEVSCTTRRLVNNIPTQKPSVQQIKQGVKKSAVIKGNSKSSSRGSIWYLWVLLLMVLASSAALLVYKNVLVLHGPAAGGVYPSRSVNPGEFAAQLSILETQFPGQRSELWKRTRIRLERHLQTAQPTEPVSLILTAGRRAERTLHCLARGLASAFSAALNASVLHIDGASKASQDSDQVKLDIDRQLRAAFEGDKPVAVIHRFEELPPGSTLIFYRYCDHENAAYKQVFLAFTVLLPQEEVEGQKSLKEVEEMVQDYIKERFVGAIRQAAFNSMDLDKFSGLWSRVSHLILPVAFENEVEQKGC